MSTSKGQAPLSGSRRNGSPALIVDGLYAGYAHADIIQDVKISIGRGELVGLAGHNGSGKTTVLLGLAGLIPNRTSALLLKGTVIDNQPAARRARQGLGILLQRDSVFSNLTVRDNLKLSVPRNTDRLNTVVDEGIHRLLEPILSRPKALAGTLSGGERRLLGLMMALRREPDVLLADEPTLGLSEQAETTVLAGLRRFVEYQARAGIIVSHNLVLLGDICERIYVMNEGRIESERHRDSSGVPLSQMIDRSFELPGKEDSHDN